MMPKSFDLVPARATSVFAPSSKYGKLVGFPGTSRSSATSKIPRQLRSYPRPCTPQGPDADSPQSRRCCDACQCASHAFGVASMIRCFALAMLLAAGAAQIVQSFGDRFGIGRAMAQVPTEKDVAPGQVNGLVVSERDYEVSLPTWWTKGRQSEGKWEF